MNSRPLLGLIALVSALALVFPAADAQAKRLGGGLSFGKQKSFSAPQKRTSPDPSTARSANGSAATAAPAKSGMMGGMLGGLLAGGLLGALFFGGAFENINFMDILIFGLIAFVLFKLLASRRPVPASVAGGAQQFDTDVHDGKDVQARTASGAFSLGGNRLGASVARPKDFNEQDFLQGARNAFYTMQQAWDTGELADLRALTSDEVFAQLQQQMQQREGNNETQVLNLEAQLLEVESGGSEDHASVMFRASVREMDKDSGLYPDPVDVEEVWHFSRPHAALTPTWYLQGIQQA